MNTKQKLVKRVIIALFAAIIIIQNFIPFLGYIPLGPLNLTIIHITVIVIALSMGPLYGGIVGGIWGVITWIRAFVWPTSPLATIVFVNPLIAILPRILIGIVAGGSFNWLKKRLAKQSSAMVLAAILGSLTNTLLVLGQIYLFYRGKSQAMYALNVNELLPYLLGVIATNGLPEAILAGLVSPLIAGPLRKRLKNN
ncbi:MAG: ECF transporter S component [Ligilactobacillus agilis]|uniref:ECF transporter S component n=1 Tax=Ligilactobacillus agilis TaxID=1601 RepID=UPI00242FEFAC|nr:ECF transporter S component [Ligilactobacillus agilis]MCI5761398.1 ECF transporter S component [Ligilactobacillus agilis]MDY4064435.1 ECF transporter S component [Ligilactobacillus agilis]